MTYTTPPTFSIGEKLPAAKLNAESTAVGELQPATASWTPGVHGSTGSPADPTVSAVSGSYQVTAGMLDATFTFTRGATAGGGYYYVTPPVSINSAWIATGKPVGEFFVTDGSTYYSGIVEVASGTGFRFRVRTGINTYSYIGPGFQAINSAAVLHATVRCAVA